MNNFLSTINWHNTRYFLLLPAIPLILILLMIGMIRYQKTVALLAGTRLYLFTYLPSYTIRLIKMILLLTGFTCLIIALLRPQWHKRTETVAQQVRDVLVALDISRSMLARDTGAGTRLEQAKEKIKALIAHMPCERVGLILFSGTAFVHCPLTTDHEAFKLFLDAVDVEGVSGGTTALDQALKKAIITFDETQGRKSKLLIFFTDGEDFSTDLSNFSQQAREKNLSVFACGVGSTQGGPIPLFDAAGGMSGHQRDQKGEVVISKLNEPMLKNLTRELGGFYCALTIDDRDIKQLGAAINKFEKEQLAEKNRELYEDVYHYFLVGSFVCFALEWLL